MWAIVMFHWLWRTKSHDIVHRQVLKREENRDGIEPRSFCIPAYNALPIGQTGSLLNPKRWIVALDGPGVSLLTRTGILHNSLAARNSTFNFSVFPVHSSPSFHPVFFQHKPKVTYGFGSESDFYFWFDEPFCPDMTGNWRSVITKCQEALNESLCTILA